MQGTQVPSIPGLGRSHTPWGKQACAPRLLSMRSRAGNPQMVKPRQREAQAPWGRAIPTATARECCAQRRRPRAAKSKSLFFFFFYNALAAAKSLWSSPTLCDPMDGSPRGSPVPGILQARTLEWLPFPSPMYESETCC